ncbi:hypothetical protein COCMIDRAFT_37547 [Bipolaris oryzae ATCC 44560]|uniref:Uncharacterized protein n=1 Tax=Bipolaris oryzae ATCC 44560 TaxID=930090 RepID=W6ZAZ6_COCMI|nr:uncharacterized protein COCMIDRAFT_37547 [Bipolaris oryzae ATCC 44560]EUC44644.1 hypothetical protein COCMIDRAFT_37547 [Bipolaris oryzae ATCC 44560]
MYVIGVVWFDTQCDYNLVTSRFLRESCVEWQPYKNYSHSSIINGLVVNFLGEVQGRWHVVKSGNRDNLPPRYEITTFKVIDYPHTEVIIGRNTIEDLAMHTIFEELRPPRFNASTISRLLLRLRNRTK